MFIVNKDDVCWNKNEIVHRKDVFVAKIFISVVLEIIFILLSMFYNQSLISLAIILPLVNIIEVFRFLNEKMIYDEKGITFNTMWNKKFFYSWDNVISLKDTYIKKEQRILKIDYRDLNGKNAYMVFSFNAYTGVPRFLEFSSPRYSTQTTKNIDPNKWFI